MARHSMGSKAAVGALQEGPLWISCNQASVAYVLSVCAIIEMVRSDLTENCLEAGADALSCQGQSHDETPWRQGHTFTSPLSPSLAEGTPLLPLHRAALKLRTIFLQMVMSLTMPSGGAAYCADTSRVGHKVSDGEEQ